MEWTLYVKQTEHQSTRRVNENRKKQTNKGLVRDLLLKSALQKGFLKLKIIFFNSTFKYHSNY